jgi:demethylmenaquinone methyltransferase / 2-methoxy-6-polyprenyl-1,4-benzoquinol methylase
MIPGWLSRQEVGLSEYYDSGRARYVQEMFTRIAPRYDLMNRLMTAGQDTGWRREVIRRAGLPARGRLLDLGAGTGDLSREALRQVPSCQAVAADFTLDMMRVGRQNASPDGSAARLDWSAADAIHLPYHTASFDAVVSGFLMRNVVDVRRSLAEQHRVLRAGGRIVILDTTPPPHTALAPLIRFHLHTVIPSLGRWVAGEAEAYNYLPDTTEAFLEPEQLAARLVAAGFQAVGFHRLMLGTIAIHWGVK